MDNETKALSERLSALSRAQRALFDLRLKKKNSRAVHWTIPKRQQENHCPLSLDQERLWFIQQLDPDSPAYNIYSAVRFHGAVDIEALTRSLHEIVRRHEIMRTSFATVEGRPVQVIEPRCTVSIPVVDLRALPAAARQAEANRLAAAAVRHPFDLSRLPLFRTLLVQVGDEDYVCPTVFHHIITDWVSFHTFDRELAALYAAFAAGLPSPLPALPIQYADFAVWQRQWLSDQVLDAQLVYWRRQLEGAPHVLELPQDKPRPAMQSPRGARQPLVLSKAHSDAMRALAQQEEATLFIVLLAVFKVLLFRLTGQDRIVVGSPIANRNQIETQELLGFFINHLVFCTDLSGNPTFRELLRRVRDVALGAYAHQDVPFGKLVEELQPQRDLSRTPLTQVVFLFLNPQQQGEVKFSGLRILPYTVNGESSKFDMTFSLWDGEDGFSGWMEYITDLFHASTIMRMTEHFRALLGGVAANPDRRVLDLPVLPEAQRHQLMVEWNETGVDYSLEMCVHHLFEAQAELRPKALAVASGDEHLGYGELNRRANRLAHHLRKLGVGPEGVVGILLQRSSQMVVAMLGVLKAGAAYLPLDPAYPKQRLAFMLADAQARVLVSQERLVEGLADFRGHVVCLHPDWESGAREGDANPVVCTRPDNLAYVIYTSGSTGQPKGVAMQHRGLVNLVRWHQGLYRVQPEDRASQVAGQAFDASVWEMWPYLTAGASLHLPDEETRGSLPALVKWLEAEAITHCFLPTPLAEAALAESWPEGTVLRNLLTGGDRLRRRPRAALPFQLWNHYGPTENTVVATCARISIEGCPESAPPIGRPIANTQVYLLGADLRPVPVGVKGEIYIGGVGLARCYLYRPDLTAANFIPNPFSEEPGERLYQTGDLARQLPDGDIEFLGRINHQVKIRGYRVELGEIEAVLCGHPGIQEAAVLAREDVSVSKRLVAYVAVHPQQDVTVGELRSYLKERLPEYMAPAAFVMLKKLPVTRHGKVDRQALLSLHSTKAEGEERFLAPSTPAEQALAEIWRQVLGIERVGVHDNFFEMGGDSILSIQIIARANQVGLRFSPKQIFQHQTVAELAAAAGKAEAIQAEQGVVTGRVRLTPIQHWFFEQNLADPHHFNQAILLEVQPGLETSVLERALMRLLAHHDALRLRFTREESRWEQVNAGLEEEVPFTRLDLSGLPDDEQRRAIEAGSGELQASLNLSHGPLVRTALFVLGDAKPSRLLMVVHHLVVDGISWRILLEDFQTCCLQLSRGETIRFPAKTTSFKQWSERLAEYARSDALEQEHKYWMTETRTRASRLPVDRVGGANTVASTRTVEVSLSLEDTRALLQEAPAAYRTQINDLLLAALAQACADWTGERCLLVDLEGHGREAIFEDVDLSRTVGWFTTIYPVLLELGEAWHVRDVLRSIKEQLRRIPNRGIGYGLLRYLGGEAQVAEKLQGLPRAEVSFNYLGQLDQVLPESSPFRPAAESSGAARGQRGSRRYLLEINGGIAGGRLHVVWTYSENAHQRSTVERLAGGFIDALKLIMGHCTSAEAGGYTPSDFPLAQLDQEKLDRLIGTCRQVEDIYPLSAVQQGILFHTLSNPGGGAYTEQLNCELHGQLDVIAFERAWQKVIGRHTILRTSFSWREFDRPLQVVHQQVNIQVDEQDWRTLPAAEQQDQLEAFLLGDRARGFDLSQPPLMRLALIRTGKDACQFVWTHHHLLLDGWSMPLVLKEVLAHYEALGAGEGLEPEPVRPYRDYIQWLQQQDPSRAATFWRETLKGYTAAARLGPDRVDAAGQSGHGDETVRVSKATTKALQLLARNHRLTLNTIVQGAWALVLSRYSDQEDLVFGVTVSGRPAAVDGIESMVGVFINTLPVRVKISRQTPVVSWLRQLQTAQVEMAQYEYSPLVQEWSDVPLGLPLFESLLVFENYPVNSPLQDQVAGVEVRGARALVRTKYPLTVVAVPGVELVLHIAYDRRRFDPKTTQRLLECLTTSLDAIVTNSEQPVSGILDALPADGRSDRRALTAAGPTRLGLERTFAAPRTPVEEVLAGIWAQVLGAERMGIHDNFFELGGHSLLATQVISRLRDVFQVELPLQDLFEATTVASLARRVETAMKAGQNLSAPPLQPIPRNQDLPLSFAQEPLWTLDQLIPGTPFFNFTTSIRLLGVLSVAALAQGLREIVRRHEALRTTFRPVNGRPVQVIGPPPSVVLPIVDLCALPEAAREAEVRRVEAEEALQPFDLAQGPLLRIHLLRLGAQDHRVQFTMHHIIADAWSMGVFVRELTALYEAFSSGHPSPLPRLPIQYADFAHWQRQWLQGPVLETQLSHWKQQLAGDLLALNLPTDYPRPSAPSFRTSRQSLHLSRTLTDALKGLSRSDGVSLFMSLLTALQVLLYRYTGQEDIRVGTLVANRNRAETEGLIGLFVTNLILPAKFSPDLTCRQALYQVRETVLGAFNNQDLPFELLVQALERERRLERTALFQVLFILQNAPMEPLQLPDLTISPMEHTDPANLGITLTTFDLILTMEEQPEGLTAWLSYKTDLFRDTTVAHMLGHFQHLLQTIVSRPQQRLSDILLCRV